MFIVSGLTVGGIGGHTRRTQPEAPSVVLDLETPCWRNPTVREVLYTR